MAGSPPAAGRIPPVGPQWPPNHGVTLQTTHTFWAQSPSHRGVGVLLPSPCHLLCCATSPRSVPKRHAVNLVLSANRQGGELCPELNAETPKKEPRASESAFCPPLGSANTLHDGSRCCRTAHSCPRAPRLTPCPQPGSCQAKSAAGAPGSVRGRAPRARGTYSSCREGKWENILSFTSEKVPFTRLLPKGKKSRG